MSDAEPPCPPVEGRACGRKHKVDAGEANAAKKAKREKMLEDMSEVDRTKFLEDEEKQKIVKMFTDLEARLL